MAKTRLPTLVTDTLDVKWSNLLKPDTNFGENSANHNITVVITPPLQKILTDLTKKSGAKKINGTTEKDGVKYIKFKSKTHVESGGGFPCVDAASKLTTAIAFGGDRVRLKLQPVVLDRDNSLSLYLNGVQIIEKGEYKPNSVSFDPVEGGFDGSTYKKPETTKEKVEEVSEEDVPF